MSASPKPSPNRGPLDNVVFVKSPKKKKFPGFRKNIYDYFTEFSSNTGIHGFKYMGEQERSILEKLYWVVLFAISLYICVSLIIQTWVKWDQSPVLVSFAQSPTPVWQVPFPAITICSETKARQRAYNFTYYYHKVIEQLTTGDGNLTQEELQRFSDSSLICDNHLYQQGNKTTSFETIEYLMSIAPPFSEVFFACKWTSLNETCSNFFSPMLTEDGMCFTFNMLDRSELFTNAVYLHGDYMGHEKRSEGWTLENGYPKTTGKDTFPRRAMSAGSKAGLFLLLRAYEQDLDYVCRGPVQGFKVLLHHPAEVPRVGTQYFRAPLNQEIVVAVKPDMMTTSQGLRNYDPHRRQCFFAEERQLQFFQNYTQQNCQVECVANFTLARCGCVAFHMPHAESTKICGSGSNVCIFEAEQELLAREVESGLSRYDDNADDDLPTNCDCLPACTSITYNAETSQADFNWPKVFEAFKANFSEFPGVQMTRLTIFFKDMQFITSERNELYGQTDFLANCGGLLGLFTGFSFLSIVEIVYFLSLRLICNVKKYGIHFWSGSKDLLNDDAYLHKEQKDLS
ncbi:Pickpocket protein 28-like Protein [Tribolium castaneum]|uniref:Pickpocket protein 28-like Protein n=1 Tax=Tribolium castaneum TaxID=7070 RepID=D6WXM6_TRICA|nr:PREDICTED: pickpocket protein 28 [Tribolium castaneum]EFA08873.2 Pickpocket protein 28-like Protein [Tribolium castaneum]|eukprot:XP_972346.1 PREDICTED: pickpocket protein 28 [Tribolium castaneum]